MNETWDKLGILLCLTMVFATGLAIGLAIGVSIHG